jgi:hypothetical protein
MTPVDVIKRVSYHDWEFHAQKVSVKGREEGTATQFYEISARIRRPDADSAGEVVLKGFSSLVPADAEESLVLEVLFNLVTDLEAHERQEFFLYSGRKIYDPHTIRES